MITVTSTPSVITNLTPATDGVVNPAVATTIPNEGFTNALTAQLGLVAPVLTENGTSVVTQAQILTQAPATLIANTTTTENASMTTLSTQQPAVLLNQSIETPTVVMLPTDLPENVLSAQDEAILSNVNDTLKFITTGAKKLGDTLPAGQSVQLQSATVSTPITQQSIQSAVNQAVTNTQVNTPAAVLAQQATPVQTGEAAVLAQPEQLDSTVALQQVQNAIAAQTQTTEKTTVATPAQVQTPVAQIQTETVEKPTVAQPQVQTEAVEKLVVAQAQVQTPEAQAETVEKPVVAQAQVQTPEAQAETIEKPVVAQAQVQTPVAQSKTVEKPVVAQAQVQTPVAQTETTEKPVVAQVQVQTPVAQAQAQTEKTVVTTPVQVKTPVVQAQAEKAVVTIPAQLQSPVVQTKSAEKNAPKTDGNAPITDAVLTAEIATQTVVQNVPEPEIEKQQTQQAETQSENPRENQNQPTVQVTVQTQVPIVTAQAVPIQIEADIPTFETPFSSSAPEDKPTLTPAKNLLADVLANRSNGNDTATNSGNKKGSDTPANSTLQTADNSLKSNADTRQFSDTKSFASLLATEKSDVTTATPSTQTSAVEKSAPQVMAAVNKLAETVKPEVPALTRPLSHPNWSEDVGERIVWMNNRNISSAEIRMNPQNLGPITVRIDMNQDQATIAFTAQNADVRNALEASIPKLRDMLSSQNVNLTDVNVSQQSSTNTDSGRSQQQAAQMAADASANGQGGNRQNQNVEVDANGDVIRSVNANGEEIVVDEFANGHVLQDNGANGLLSLFA